MYQSWHDSIIDRARNRTLQEGVYYEWHHVVPVCDGGDPKGETVPLTKKEHELVHMLLYHMTGNRQHIGAKYLIQGNDAKAASACAKKWREEFKQIDPQGYHQWCSESNKKTHATMKLNDPEGYSLSQSKRAMKAVIFDGIWFESIKECAKHYGVTMQTIRKRINRGLGEYACP